MRVRRPPLGLLPFVLALGWANAPSAAPRLHKVSSAAEPLCVLRADTQVHRSFVPPRQRAAAIAAEGDVQPNVTVGVLYTGFTPQAQAAFQYAVDLWASQLSSTVPITITAKFMDLGTGVLGSSGPSSFWVDVPGGSPGVIYPSALANRIAGFDIDPTTSDIDAAFGSSFNWYFGTDGNAPAGTYDFVTVVLHELTHGLGFTGSARVLSTGLGRWGFTVDGSPYPVIYDRFVVNGSGQSILNTGLFPQGSTTLAAQLTGGTLFFTGPKLLAANGAAARLYVPGTWQSGSSYSHLDEATYLPGNVNSLMTPALAFREAIHDPGPITRGMFQDMGWACTVTLSASATSFTGAGGSGSLTIGTQPGCSWSIAPAASWISFTSTASGVGPATVAFTVAPNPNSSSRSTQVSVSGVTLSFTQTGVVCTFTVAPLSDSIAASGGTRSVTITATPAQCMWTASSDVAWITPRFASGSGSQTLSYTVQPNTSRQARRGVLTIAGVGVTVVQPAPRSGIADFDGNGLGDAFLYNPITGAWSIQLSGPSGFVQGASGTWAPGWTVQVADFNGDGLADLLLYNPANGLFFKATNLGNGQFSFFGYQWAAQWSPTVIDFNGDGRSDVFLYNVATGRWFVCLTSPSSDDFLYTAGAWAPGWQIHGGDFDGDGRGDLFLYNPNGNTDANSGRWFRVMTQVDGTFAYVAGDVRWANTWTITPADFDGDGRTDLFLYDATGRWFTVQFTPTSALYIGGTWAPGWTIRAGDFDADGLSDLFLYNSTNGQWFVALTVSPGTFAFFGGVWAPQWTIATSDSDADGRVDEILYNPVNGTWFRALTVAPGVFSYTTGTWPTGAGLTTRLLIP